MSPTLEFTDHLAAITEAAQDAVADAGTAGLPAAVVTCPGWTVQDLVSHLGGVHRWAAAIVGAALTSNLHEADEAAVMSPPADGLLDWLAAGAGQLVDTLEAAPIDLAALVFLRHAPEPRRFWARRQAHETTIHAVDALSARLGHLPTAAQADIDPDLAIDGIDELLTGFITRRSSALRTDERLVVAISPSDSDVGWTVTLTPDPPVTADGADPDADVLLTGTAAGLYLGLWNRGDEIAADGDPDFIGLWRDKVRVSWV